MRNHTFVSPLQRQILVQCKSVSCQPKIQTRIFRNFITFLILPVDLPSYVLKFLLKLVWLVENNVFIFVSTDPYLCFKCVDKLKQRSAVIAFFCWVGSGWLTFEQCYSEVSGLLSLPTHSTNTGFTDKTSGYNCKRLTSPNTSLLAAGDSFLVIAVFLAT